MFSRLGTRIIQYLERHPLWFFIIAAAVVGLVYWFAGPYSFVQQGDTINWFVPRYSTMAEQVRVGETSRWIPQLTMGVDRYALDVHPWYIGTLIFVFLSPLWGYMAITLLSYFVGGWSLYHLLYRRMGMSSVASVIGALLFMLYLQLNQPIFCIALAIAPAALYWIDVVMASSRRMMLMTAIPLGFLVAFFGNAVLSLPYVLGAIIIFTLLRYRARPKALLVLALFIIAAFGFYFDQLRAVVDLMHTSYRSSSVPIFVASRYFKQVIEYLNFYAVPLIFGGALWLLLLRSHRADERKKYSMIGESLIVVALIVVVAQLEPHRFFGGASFVGKLSAFPLERFTFVLPLFVSVIVAGAIDVLREARLVYYEKVFSLRRIGVISIVIFLAMVYMSSTAGNVYLWLLGRSSFAYLRHPGLHLLSEEARSSQMPFRVMDVGSGKYGWSSAFITLNGLEYAGGGVNIPTERQRVWWQNIDRTGSIIMKIIFQFHGNDGQHTRELEKLYATDLDGAVNLTLLGLANVKYLVSSFQLNGSGITLVSQPTPRPKQTAIREKVRGALIDIFTAPPLYIYRVASFTDRFFLAPEVRMVENSDQMTVELDHATIDGLRAKPLVEAPYANDVASVIEGNDHNRRIESGKVALLEVKPQELALRVSVEQSEFLVVTNQFSSFWNVYVDGVARTLIPVYGNFWGVVVHPQDNKVVFRYEP